MRGVSRSSRYAGRDAVAACSVRCAGRMIGRTPERERRFFIRPRLTTTLLADGPSRDIPAHRLRHGAAPRLSPRTEGERRCVSPLQRWITQARPPGVFAKQAVPTIACGTPGDSGVTVVTILVRLFSLRMRLRMRSRIRRSARPHVRVATLKARMGQAPSA